MRILVTGAAGFVGSLLTNRLARSPDIKLLAIDNLNSYYSPNLKSRRVDALIPSHVRFERLDIADRTAVQECIRAFKPDQVFHLAAQPGIRLDIDDHYKYVDSNLTGFSNMLIGSQREGVSSFVYASSSSVYGRSSDQKLKETQSSLSPTSFYGATKLANEVLARSYSDRYGIKTRGLRFFTVYGPWGRPDMAYFRIIASLILKRKFTLFGDGSVQRDFTYVDDVVAITEKLGSDLHLRDKGFSDVVNVGGGTPISIVKVIDILSHNMDQRLEVDLASSDPSDMPVTDADVTYLFSLIGKHDFYKSEDGLRAALEWGLNSVTPEELASWTT
jgi:UDP-glucuronate 4-epimerase